MIFLNIIWPVFAMVAWVFVVWFWLLIARMRHAGRVPYTDETFATAESSRRYFEPVELPGDNLRNLFEMPVLFFALVPLLVIAQQATAAQVVLAWVFVALRVAHSYIHIVVRRVRLRAPTYWLSTAVLMAMWIGFAIDMIVAASRYHAAMSAIGVQP